MKVKISALSFGLSLWCFLPLLCQAQEKTISIGFVSDTQSPMWIEKVFLKENQNERATELIFEDIIKQRPEYLFILGDVVALGYKEKKWIKMDQNLEKCKTAGIQVSAILGNHDVMTRAKKGEAAFSRRFNDHVRTGTYRIIDSIAIVTLNSNFKKLSATDLKIQEDWLTKILEKLDTNQSVLGTIISCHHAPYSNSKIVGSSTKVQRYFVPAYLKSRKACLFITGHSHNFEHFIVSGKDFLVIGGGGGIEQPLNKKYVDVSEGYKPSFHYILLHRVGTDLKLQSRNLEKDFSGFKNGISINVKVP